MDESWNRRAVVRRDPDGWTLVVDGVDVVRRESYQLVANVEYALSHPGALWPSESHEIAESIRRWADR